MRKVIILRLILFSICITTTFCLAACEKKVKKPIVNEDIEIVKKDSLTTLQETMNRNDYIASVAYLGHKEKGDSTPIDGWIKENCPELIEEMPFILDIPLERIVGESDNGDLYCIVPKGDDTSLGVNYVEWNLIDDVLWPTPDYIYYRDENAKPVMVFTGYDKWRDEPNVEINITTNDGRSLIWYPNIHANGKPIIPIDQNGSELFLDFTQYDDKIVPDYYVECVNETHCLLPPLDQGLMDTAWTSDHWYIDLAEDHSDPRYSGQIDIYYQNTDKDDYEHRYTGTWIMKDYLLHLELVDDKGNVMVGDYPVAIDISGEHLIIHREHETYFSPPFFDEGVIAMEFTASYY